MNSASPQILQLAILLVLATGCIQAGAGKQENESITTPENAGNVGNSSVGSNSIFNTPVVSPGNASVRYSGSSNDSIELPNLLLWPRSSDCRNEKISFEFSPIEEDKITYIEPMGELTGRVGGHIIPGDHIAIHYEFGPSVPPASVHVPADGFLVMAERHVYSPPEDYPAGLKHYHLYFEHSCFVYTGFVHVTQLSQELLDSSVELKALDAQALDKQTNLYLRVPVNASQVIGTSSALGFVGMLTVDSNVTLEGYANPASYYGQPWRLHVVAPFDYFPSDLKARLYSKVPRTAEPKGGKIDFDARGKLVGNWFEKGVEKWVSDNNNSTASNCGNFVCPYWQGHLSFAYDFIDPAQVRVNTGYPLGDNASHGPYGVKNNSPNPASVSIESGVVKFELVKLVDESAARGLLVRDGNPVFTSNSNEALGVFLVEMTGESTIKAEFFEGKTPAEVSGFTANAKIFER